MAKRFDIIVVGGGHAGAEAAWAASRMGATVALITVQHSAIARMSCNPAIGGLAKGQMVREIDALGGIMGLATDEAGIQFRMLNRSKGPAVWAPRAQADRDLYPAAVQRLLATASNIEIVEGLVDDVLRTPIRSPRQTLVANAGDNSPAGAPSLRITGVVLKDGRELHSDAVILTTGTFLRGLMHTGETQIEGGRVGEHSAVGMSRTLLDMGFVLGRLKTGTPPRLHRDSIHYDDCQLQPGDDLPLPFSFINHRIDQPQLPCWITYTNSEAHEHITSNLHRAPMYSGQIESTGPRYCPSIEDKVVRFADKPRHQVFLEPEGYDNERVYCNGISTSLPADVQEHMVRAIPGLQHARIVQHGYAVEYDWVPTAQTRLSLETKLVEGLFLAGQINGTSGYEEAAGQGMLAGLNAVRQLRGETPVVLGRDQAYIGVMVDDLITKPPTEPYRMFTSRAEYRLQLRSDNADLRLTPLGRELGIVDNRRWAVFQARVSACAAIRAVCAQQSHQGGKLSDWLRRPEVNVEQFAAALPAGGNGSRPFSAADLWQVLVDAKYAGYLERQSVQVERFKRLESMHLPRDLNFQAIPELRLEAREKLAAVAPRTLGQASRVSGINPADITILWLYASGKRPSCPN